MAVRELTRAEARRVAVHAQLLDLPRPTDLADVVDRLTVLQIDPTAAVAPSADLVLWSRLGRSYDPADLTRALERDRKPKDRRRWGYFALPVLHGDELVGKLDATADRKGGTLVVTAIHEDVPFTAATTAAVHAEIEDLATWLGLDVTGA